MSLIQCKCEICEYEIIYFLVGAYNSLCETSINNFLKPIRWFHVQALYYITPYHKGENPDRSELIFFKKNIMDYIQRRRLKGKAQSHPKPYYCFSLRPELNWLLKWSQSGGAGLILMLHLQARRSVRSHHVAFVMMALEWPFAFSAYWFYWHSGLCTGS